MHVFLKFEIIGWGYPRSVPIFFVYEGEGKANDDIVGIFIAELEVFGEKNAYRTAAIRRQLEALLKPCRFSLSIVLTQIAFLTDVIGGRYIWRRKRELQISCLADALHSW